MEVTPSDVRTLVDREPDDVPVTSLYLNTDGARFPRASDYEARLDGLLREVRATAATLEDPSADAVRADADEVSRWVRREFDRADVRGLGVFSSGGRIFETVQVAVGVRNIARVSPRPYVVPLQALLGRYHHIAMVLVRRDRARVLRYQLGVLEEYFAVASDVHGQHEQGGWSQARYQRGIEEEVAHHHRDVGDVLLKLHEVQPLDALVVSGAHAEATEFVKTLHPYLSDVVHGDVRSTPTDASIEDVKAELAQVEQELVSDRRSHLLQRLAAGQGQGVKQARGIRHVLEAVNTKRVDTLFVVEGAGEPGFKSATGALALHEHEASAYGEPVTQVPDLIDEIIEEAVRAGAHVELFRDAVRLDGHPVAAVLRF